MTNVGLNNLKSLGLRTQALMELSAISGAVYDQLVPRHQMFQTSLKAAIQQKANYFDERRIAERPSAVRFEDAFKAQAATMLHQNQSNSLTCVKFITADLLVTASDDGFVKLCSYQDGVLKLKAVLLKEKPQTGILCLEVSERYVVASFENSVVAWNIERCNTPLLTPCFESELFGLRKKRNAYEETPEDVTNLCLYQDVVMAQQQTQVVLINLKQKSQTVLFRGVDQENPFEVGWIALSARALYVLFRLDEFQYLGCFELVSITAPTAWAIYLRDQSKCRALEGECGAPFFVSLEIPRLCSVNISTSLIPVYLGAYGNKIVLGFRNVSHFFTLEEPDVFQTYQQLIEEIGTQKKKSRPSRGTYEQQQFLQVNVPLTCYSLHDIRIPQNLLDAPVYTVDQFEYCEETETMAVVFGVESMGKTRKFIAFYGPDKDFLGVHCPTRVASFMGFSGAGLQFAPLRLSKPMSFVGQSGRVHKNISVVWIVPDIYSTDSGLDKNITPQMVLHQSDIIAYILSPAGDDVLSALHFPGPKDDIQLDFLDMDTAVDAFVLTNGIGQMCLFGLETFREGASAMEQFLAIESPGLVSKYNLSHASHDDEEELVILGVDRSKPLLSKKLLKSLQNTGSILSQTEDTINLILSTACVREMAKEYLQRQGAKEAQRSILVNKIKPGCECQGAFKTFVLQLLDNIPLTSLVGLNQLQISQLSADQSQSLLRIEALNLPQHMRQGYLNMSLPVDKLYRLGFFMLEDASGFVNNCRNPYYVPVANAYTGVELQHFVNQNVVPQSSRYTQQRQEPKNIVTFQQLNEKKMKSRKQEKSDESAVEPPDASLYQEDEGSTSETQDSNYGIDSNDKDYFDAEDEDEPEFTESTEGNERETDYSEESYS